MVLINLVVLVWLRTPPSPSRSYRKSDTLCTLPWEVLISILVLDKTFWLFFQHSCKIIDETTVVGGKGGYPVMSASKLWMRPLIPARHDPEFTFWATHARVMNNALIFTYESFNNHFDKPNKQRWSRRLFDELEEIVMVIREGITWIKEIETFFY